MVHLSSTHRRTMSPYHSRLSSPARCSNTHLLLGRWSPSRLLPQHFLCPHIITSCHFIIVLSLRNTHIFCNSYFPDHLPFSTFVYMGASRLTSRSMMPSSLPDPHPHPSSGSPCSNSTKQQTTKGRPPRPTNAELI
jgi:hypothetical protein